MISYKKSCHQFSFVQFESVISNRENVTTEILVAIYPQLQYDRKYTGIEGEEKAEGRS
jgi:hypothetical protein